MNKFRSPGKFHPVYKSEVKDKVNDKYVFNTLTIDTDTLCGNDHSQEILIQVWQFNASKSHRRASKTSLTLNKFGESSCLSLKGDNKCTVTLNNYEVHQRATFLDYIFGGCEIGV